MMTITSLILGSLVSAILQPSVTSDQGTPVELQPLNDWQFEKQRDRCVLRRDFGDPDRPTTLELRRVNPWNYGFEVALSSAEYSLGRRTIEANWSPGGLRVSRNLLNYEVSQTGREAVVFAHGLWDGAPSKLKGEAAKAYMHNGGPDLFRKSIESFEVSGGFQVPVSFQSGPMSAVPEILGSCMDEILSSNGVMQHDIDGDYHPVILTNAYSISKFAVRNIPTSFKIQESVQIISFLTYVGKDLSLNSCKLVSIPYQKQYEDLVCDHLKRRAKYRFKTNEKPRTTFFILNVRADGR